MSGSRTGESRTPTSMPRAGWIHWPSLVLFSLAVAVLVGTGIATYVSVRRTTTTAANLEDTLGVVAGLEQTLGDATVAQLTQRTYAASKDPRVLDSFLSSSTAMRNDVLLLYSIADSDSQRTASFGELKAEVDSFRTLLTTGVPVQPGGPPSPGTPATAEAIRTAGEQLRATIRGLQDQENANLQDDAQASDQAADRTLVITSVLSAMAVLVLIAAYFAMTRQIQKRRNAERQLTGLLVQADRLNESAQAANKELEAFCYSVSHDLRAPLRTIDGFSKALGEDYDAVLDDNGRHLIGRVRAATQRMGQLIDDLLGLSRVSRGDFSKESVDISALAESALADLKLAEPERAVSVRIEPGLRAEGDSRLIGVVLQNLLGNAWKYTSKHSSAEIQVGCELRQGEKVFFVRDDGAGFDMQYIDKLFGVFQRLHHVQEFPGTGVGLATVQRIVARHGGRVWAESEVEHGATFYFTLEPSQELQLAA